MVVVVGTYNDAVFDDSHFLFSLHLSTAVPPAVAVTASPTLRRALRPTLTYPPRRLCCAVLSHHLWTRTRINAGTYALRAVRRLIIYNPFYLMIILEGENRRQTSQGQGPGPRPRAQGTGLQNTIVYILQYIQHIFSTVSGGTL